MKIEELNKYLGNIQMTIVEAMQRIDKNNAGILYIADEQRKLIGSLTDGDIRRWIIKTGELTGKIEQAMFCNPKFLFEENYNYETEKNFFSSNTLQSVPIVDKNKKIINIIFRNKNAINVLNKNNISLSKIPIIIMAGGKGTRLYPYTKIIPKPLIPIGDVPIIERILNRFRKYGAEKFFITLNHKKEMIKSYLNELNVNYEINYVEENEPLGTAGSIRLIDEKFDTPIIVTNCDILIETNYEDIFLHHKKFKNALTIVSSLKNTTIPYGVIHSREEGIVSSMEEKPIISYLINTGMYIINAEHIEKIPKDEVFNMTDLIDRLIKENYKVGIYPISEDSFLDMGEFEEMKRMEEKIYSNVIR